MRAESKPGPDVLLLVVLALFALLVLLVAVAAPELGRVWQMFTELD